MTGIPQFNFPAFEAAVRRLRVDGFDVVSPHELDSPVIRAMALKSPDGVHRLDAPETWGDMLARDVKVIADDGIKQVCVLPGWQRSKGARLETFVARALVGLPVYRFYGKRVPLWRLAIAWVLGR